jgi:RHS repeat-associated protein
MTLSVGSLAVGAERETGPEAAAAAVAPAAPVPAPTTAFKASAGRLLPADAVFLATLAPPPAPAMAPAGAVLLQGGGPPPPQLRYYALDALGSVRVTFDAAGNVIGRADYEPFGAAVAASTTGTQPRQQFTGQEREGEVGIDYFGARMYGPQHGRMPSVDPLYVGAVEEPQRWNRYAYGLNSPVVMVDPDGRRVNSSLCTASIKALNAKDYHCTGGGGTVFSPSPGQGPLLGGGGLGSLSGDPYAYFDYMYGPGYRPNWDPVYEANEQQAQQSQTSGTQATSSGQTDGGEQSGSTATSGWTATTNINADGSAFGSGVSISLGSGWALPFGGLPRPVWGGAVGAGAGMPRTPGNPDKWNDARKMMFGVSVAATLNLSFSLAPQGAKAAQGETWVFGVSNLRFGVTTVNGSLAGVSGGVSLAGPVPFYAFSVRTRVGGTYRPF